MKIQVIGLPGCGKSTQIKKFLEAHTDVHYLDICNFIGICREQKFKQALRNHQGFVIAESACGVPNIGHIVRINTPADRTYEQLLKRDGVADEEYLSLLSTQMVAAHATLETPEDLPGYLTTILRR